MADREFSILDTDPNIFWWCPAKFNSIRKFNVKVLKSTNIYCQDGWTFDTPFVIYHLTCFLNIKYLNNISQDITHLCSLFSFDFRPTFMEKNIWNTWCHLLQLSPCFWVFRKTLVGGLGNWKFSSSNFSDPSLEPPKPFEPLNKSNNFMTPFHC